MASRKAKAMSNEQLVATLDTFIGESVGASDGELSRERQDVLKFYNGAEPKPHHNGNSKFVSMDVYESVEAMKATLLETFAAGSRIVEFAPDHANDVNAARIASLYTDFVVFRQNDGYNIFSNVMHDGLMARVGIVKVWWDKREDEVEELFEGITLDQYDALLAEDDVEATDDMTVGDDGLLSGTIVRKVDKSQVRIEVIPPEDFLISARSTKLDSFFCAHRVKKTFGDLKREGWTQAQLDEIGTHADVGMETNLEVLARFEKIGAERAGAEELQESLKWVYVHECYVEMDLDGEGSKLWRIEKAGNVVRDRERVDRRPFCVFVPLPIPHAFHGSNFAAKVIPIQNARTVLTRAILDHAVITNNPRYKVVKGALTNPREMLDNRLGGLVNVTRPDGVLPLEQAPLNPFVFQTIAMLDQSKEDRTGVSRLSQGLNKDAVSKQNSQGLVEDLVTLGMQRQKIVARNFAEGFLKPLFLLVYQLVIENERQEKVVELAGEWVPVTPQEWQARTRVSVALRLGYGERDREAQEHLGLHTLLTSDPGLAPMYGKEQRYNMIKRFMEMKGCLNVNDYLLPPDKVPPPQPDPMLVAEMKLKERGVAVQETQAKVALFKAQSEAKADQLAHSLDQMRLQLDAMAKQREQERKDFEAASRDMVARVELALAQRNADEAKVIVSPNS